MGPIAGGSRGWPFAAALVDLAARGYVEDEWFIEGDAPRYRAVGDPGRDGRWAAERAGSGAFRTRALVRRPTDLARCNGTVVVEWNNVTSGHDIAEAGEGNVIFEEGLVWIGVSAQRVGVHGMGENQQGLLQWDPERYATLHIDDDALSYGIFTEVTRALAGNERQSGPLDGLDVQKLLAIGGSQSAMRLLTYINAVQPLERLFDGFVPFTSFGIAAPLTDAAPFGSDETVRTKAQVRDDLGLPVLVVNTECEAGMQFPVRQPDTDLFRCWEVAGAPHAPRLHMERIAAKLERDGLGGPGGNAIDLDVLSPIPFAPVLDAGIGHMQAWMHTGTPPPSQPLIEVADGGPPKVVRDSDGNAVGGVRVPELAVPTGVAVAEMVEAGDAGLMGRWQPWDDVAMKARYPSRNGLSRHLRGRGRRRCRRRRAPPLRCPGRDCQGDPTRPDVVLALLTHPMAPSSIPRVMISSTVCDGS
ncbi:MAG TPA: alpha/beta hydrolase domain-containing protein [Acidimicrobiales bacterium]